MQKQRAGSSDCGVHAVVNATTITFGEDPLKYHQEVMRSHRMECLATMKIEVS